jgi:NADPH-dependent curcumin reductase CurA
LSDDLKKRNIFMSQIRATNRQVLLASRPVGAPKPDNFSIVETPIPELVEGQVLLKTLYLSLDPYMRGRMSDAPSYAAPVAVGGVMVGGTVSRVVESRHDSFEAGDLVLGSGGWQTLAVIDGAGLFKLHPSMPQPSLALGVLGMPGFTAYMGLLDIGNPQADETVVVAAASGAVGSVVGQVAKLKGCRAVGIAGGAEKCRYVIDELGFDDCIDHYSPDFAQKLKDACPNGIDVYFENVGGAVFEAVLPLLNVRARVPLCGLIANYNDTSAKTGSDLSASLPRTLLTKRIKMQGFIIFDDYGSRYQEFLAQMSVWLNAGLIQFREDVVDGLENAPQAFIGLLEGKNFGKLLVQVAKDDFK